MYNFDIDNKERVSHGLMPHITMERNLTPKQRLYRLQQYKWNKLPWDKKLFSKKPVLLLEFPMSCRCIIK